MARAHGLKEPAGIDFVPHSRFHHGRFGRLFRNLDAADHSSEALEALAATMVDPNEPPAQPGGWSGQQPSPDQGDNPNIPAGYTYFGQFVDHDITFDPASSLQRWNDLSALHNFRTPRFDLDSVYGEGPDDEPFLYDEDTARTRMLLDRSREDKGEFDLPRNTQGVALIGDPRNDENVIVSQLQVAFLRAHNKLADASGFEEARRQLRWHYQYVVVNDFLPRIVPADVMSSIRPADGLLEAPELRFFGEKPYMPVEFSVAAYRFGHSMIRPRYDVNDIILDKPIFDGDGMPSGGQDLRGFQPLLDEWGVKWSKFLPIEEVAPQPSRLIDTGLADGLRNVPKASPANLAIRNLLRGKALGLPWGEAVAKRMGLTPLGPEEIGIGDLGLDEKVSAEFNGRTPLWYYVLQGAKVTSGGERLGPVGGRIVAETILGLFATDPFSYANIEPAWTPTLQGAMPQSGEDFQLSDLIRFAVSA
jgi:hypothetical protein